MSLPLSLSLCQELTDPVSLSHTSLTDITGRLSLSVEEGPNKDCAACVTRIQNNSIQPANTTNEYTEPRLWKPDHQLTT